MPQPRLSMRKIREVLRLKWGLQLADRKIARSLVERRLAACVQVTPGVRSVYQWQGNVEEEDEVLLVIKSRRDLFKRLRARLREMHSYEIPEVIALSVVDGLPDYLSWIDREVSGPPARLLTSE